MLNCYVILVKFKIKCFFLGIEVDEKKIEYLVRNSEKRAELLYVME